MCREEIKTRTAVKNIAGVGRCARSMGMVRSAPVALPYKISTLLFCFGVRDDVLLLERAREPNRGLWSPCGGKLQTDLGESPYACACREAREELGVSLVAQDLHLTGVVSECGYEGQAHWLMFLFEVRPRITRLPPAMEEGRFAFHTKSDLDELRVPPTDRDWIWPMFWKHRGGFFAAHCRCGADESYAWVLEQSSPAVLGC